MSSLLLMPSASNVVAISNWIFNLVHISSVIVTNWVPFTSAALRAAVHAFKQEDHVCEFTSMKAAKRKREQPEQQTEGSDGKTLALDLHVAGEQASSLDGSRPRGVQFPFAVGDQVLIKGNKRTPERFVGKEAIITTQCLNGWYELPLDIFNPQHF
jgi:hypothetical protein